MNTALYLTKVMKAKRYVSIRKTKLLIYSIRRKYREKLKFPRKGIILARSRGYQVDYMSRRNQSRAKHQTKKKKVQTCSISNLK